MPAKRVNPNTVKLHRSYSVSELAACCGVHKNTVRNWQDEGLEAIDATHPLLFKGRTVRAFLTRRNVRRKRPCLPGTLFCVRCREPRRPAGGMVDYCALKPASGDLSAICETCDGIMHRRVREADLPIVMPGIAVQIAEASQRLSGRAAAFPNCDNEGHG